MVQHDYMFTKHRGFILIFSHLEKLGLSIFSNQKAAPRPSQYVMSPLQQSYLQEWDWVVVVNVNVLM